MLGITEAPRHSSQKFVFSGVHYTPTKLIFLSLTTLKELPQIFYVQGLCLVFSIHLVCSIYLKHKAPLILSWIKLEELYYLGSVW